MSYFCGLRLSGFNETKTEMFLKNQLRRFARRCWVMTRRHPLLPFLLLATLALDAVLLAREIKSIDHYVTAQLCLIYCFMMQCNLLGIWISQTYKYFSIRLIFVCSILSAFYYLLYKNSLYLFGDQDDFKEAMAILVAFSATISSLANSILSRTGIVFPRYRVRSLLFLSTAVAIACAILKQLNFYNLVDWQFSLFAPLTVLAWRISHWTDSWRRNLVLLLLWPLHYLPFLDFGKLSRGVFRLDSYANPPQEIFLWISCAYFFVLIWSFGLQYKSQPKRRKREQATLVKPEQPVRVPNQDVDPIDSTQPTKPDDKANDEPPGPIDLTV